MVEQQYMLYIGYMYLNLIFQINEDGDVLLYYWIGVFVNEVFIVDFDFLCNKNEDIGL